MKVFLFDIGNVLTNFDFPRLLQAYAEDSGRPLSPQTELDDEMYNEVEKGRLSEEDYVAYLNEAKGLNWTTDNLHQIWQEIFSLNETGTRLFDKAKASDVGVYTLSNIADYHVRAIENNWNGFFEGTTGLFFSYKMGVRKPDPRIYEMALEELGVSGEQCFFIDDLEQNVAEARNWGIEAHQFVPENYAEIERKAHEFFGW
ncbi:HAD family hydrolase [Pontiella sp.]|uniref:HAD family hydrolase n=1 Tax=Pontiella sp. TaxID=2837462 RepID=UPI0035631B07